MTILHIKSCYYSFQLLAILYNVYLCSEIIYTLIAPIAASRKRMIIYYVISALIWGFMMIYCSIFVQTQPEKSLFLKLFEINIFVFACLSGYLLFGAIGILSLFYLILRFCRHRSFGDKVRTTYVSRHIIYVICYLAMMFPSNFYGFLKITNHQKVNDTMLFLAICCTLSSSFILFFIRGLELGIFKVK